jgi:quercetin dioxygenase-like cupin family protein
VSGAGADGGWARSHLDNGVTIHMKAGDVCVQRGTIHGWTNPHDKPARVYFVLTAAKPVEINGKPLDNAGFEEDQVASGGKS